ncbi:MAG: ABC transporter permease [Anaerolineales bacterium]|nr:ABC transporter permease [Anaerolineales bacterium]
MSLTNNPSAYDTDAIGSPALHELRELWRYRDLLRFLISNSIKTRYKRSSLGVIWTLLNPLLSTLVLTIAFSQIFRFEIANYPIYLLVGFLFWNFFSQTTTQAMNTLIWGSSLLKRIYVPRTIFAVSVLGNGLVNLLLALIPLALIMLALGHPLTLNILMLPVAILLMAMFTLGIALFLSTLAVFFVDVVDMYGIFLTVWFYLTPVIYPASIVPERFAILVKLNPMTTMLGLFRSILYDGQMPSASSLAISAAMSILSLLVGWLVYTKRVDEFAYRI